ncbi:hypothetical protein B9Z19DRAFT_1061555 [Tuber borchii]|uniref:Uncharacterized protein n=1 Tax=Tuber borchii TaxID=42251 RepID=A0A2T7A514_TUBBO|nr:hypothetical protein B9Z19DRAFT_1061555 [Tuber borchii]
MSTFRIGLHSMSKTPPPQTFSPSRGDRHNQATSQRQYCNPFSEQAASPWQQDHYLNDHSDGNARFISGSGLTPNTPPNDGSSPSSLGWNSQYSTVDSYGSSNTSYSQGSGSIDPRSTQSGSSPENSHQIPLTAPACSTKAARPPKPPHTLPTQPTGTSAIIITIYNILSDKSSWLVVSKTRNLTLT